MTDAKRNLPGGDLARSMLRLSWAMSLLGAQQAGRMLRGEGGRRSFADLDAVCHSVEGRMESPVHSLFRTGDQIQRGMVDFASDAFGRAFSSGAAAGEPLETVSTLMGDLARRSVDGLGVIFSGAGVDALLELRNKAAVFVLVREVARRIGIPDEFPLPLDELLAKAYALGPYEALWAVEGLGHDYAGSYWKHGLTPRGLLNGPSTPALPAASLMMLHAGIGLSFAEKLLEDADRQTSTAELRRIVAQVASLCRDSSLPEYIGAAYESLGLVTGLFHEDLVEAVSDAVRETETEIYGYYWHGVGRSTYFRPANFLPCSTWQVFESVRRQACDETARRNAVAGAAWGFTLVNQREPRLMAALLVAPHGAELAREPGFANGLASSLIMRDGTTPEAPFLRSYLEYRPDGARTARFWDELVREPAAEALYVLGPRVAAEGRLDEIFQFAGLGPVRTEGAWRG